MTAYDTQCAEPGCDGIVHARGLCHVHYRVHKKAQTLPPRVVRVKKAAAVCARDGCARSAHAKGLCQLHWRQARGPCTQGGCDRPIFARDVCIAHWKQLRAGEPLTPTRPYQPQMPARGQTCKITGCAREVYARGLCTRHRRRTQSSAECEISGCTQPRHTRGLCLAHRPLRQPPCSMADCDVPAFARGLCARHYRRQADARQKALRQSAAVAQEPKTTWPWPAPPRPPYARVYDVATRKMVANPHSHKRTLGDQSQGLSWRDVGRLLADAAE